MLCSQQPSIGFIVLREVMRNGGKLPHFDAATSRFGKSPGGALHSAYSENFHEFHKD